MKKSKLIINLSIIVLLSACGVVKKTVTSDTLEIKKNDVITKPQLAEISIENRKIEGFFKVRKKDYYPNPKESCTNLALNDAIVKGKCDFVVQPMYEIEEDNTYISVKVSGFAGFYKKFRDIVESDTAAFKTYEKINQSTNVNIAKPKNVTKIEKNKKGGAIAGAILAGILVPLIIIIASI